jgi:hypothetical protein
MMTTPEQQRQYLLKELEKRPLSSWDWEVDEAFARFLGRNDVAEEIRRAIDSASVTVFRITYFEQCRGREIQRLRLRRLP